MFGAPNLRQSKKLTQPLVVMGETFRMVASSQNEPFIISPHRKTPFCVFLLNSFFLQGGKMFGNEQ